MLYFICMDCFVDLLGLYEQLGVYFFNCVDGIKQLYLYGNGDIFICELCYLVVIGNIYDGILLNEIYVKQLFVLVDFLENWLCFVYDVLFVGEQVKIGDECIGF